ncbi:MAG: hypothetical protein SF052_01510 [Bacteroidia bacterium]|nr:hypothetical protein [Bacteroidia bacterium]
MKQYLLLSILFALMAACGFAQNPAEELLYLTGKAKNHPEVLAFYKYADMDTSSRFGHSSRKFPGLALAFDAATGYTTVHQASIGKEYTGELPFGFSREWSSAQAAAVIGPSLATSPGYLTPVVQHLAVKGGLAMLLNFENDRLRNIYSLGATTEMQTLTGLKSARFVAAGEGCLAGDCFEGFSVMRRKSQVLAGNFDEGLLYGYAQAFYDSGNFFHGTYAANARTSGVYFFTDGKRFSGTYNEEGGALRGILTYKDGTKFDGLMENGKIKEGKMTYKSGMLYSGTFKENGYYLSGSLTEPGKGTFTGTYTDTNKPYNGTFRDTAGKSFTIENGVRKP